jgi:choline dehydrogenase-like flavoprotein
MYLGSERDWSFQAQPNTGLNGRSVHLAMGRVLGGGSSINVMVWARGHQSDWDFFASEAGDPAWGYQSVLEIYRRIEDWHGVPDPKYRGTGGPVFVEPAPNPNPIAPAMLEAARLIGIPTFENQNGRIMESDGGASMTDLRARSGTRQSVFRSYVFPCMDRPNLTVLTHALVTRLSFEGKRATGVEISFDANFLSDPDDLKAAITCVELCREIGNSAPLRPFTKREVMPGNLKGAELENFVRNVVESYFHQTCTAKMGRDSMSVVDGSLRVYGIENLRIADGSILPRVITGNTMAACVIIGERAGELLRIAHMMSEVEAHSDQGVALR